MSAGDPASDLVFGRSAVPDDEAPCDAPFLATPAISISRVNPADIDVDNAVHCRARAGLAAPSCLPSMLDSGVCGPLAVDAWRPHLDVRERLGGQRPRETRPGGCGRFQYSTAD